MEQLDQNIIHAGKKGGQFLDRIGIYDLSKLTKEQYYDYCSVVCHEFFETYVQEQIKD